MAPAEHSQHGFCSAVVTVKPSAVGRRDTGSGEWQRADSSRSLPARAAVFHYFNYPTVHSGAYWLAKAPISKVIE